AQALFQDPQQQADADAVEAAAEGGGRGQPRRPQAGGAPVALLAGPGAGPVVQGGPGQDGGQDPGLVMHVFLGVDAADGAEQAGQWGRKVALPCEYLPGTP